MSDTDLGALYVFLTALPAPGGQPMKLRTLPGTDLEVWRFASAR
jgi:hypothetical protein